MSESMSSPWIRDYFFDVAETHGSQLFNTTVSSAKKKVQLTDFLTCQENSYVWAWISDKDHKVSVRISRDAADLYMSNHGRKIIDCRFSVVSISGYRPMFSPRPLGPNATGNTSLYHLSLEIDHVKSVGVGGHLFGTPRDLESDGSMKEWVLGLRQDGGGGNILKLRKEQGLAKNEKFPPSPPPPSLHTPLPQCPAIKPTEDLAKPKPEQPHDFKRAYTKRWRTVEANPWRFAVKPAVEERPDQPTHVHAEPRLDPTSNLESCHYGPLGCPTPPLRMPSPTSRPQPQGTPTDWSLSDRGSPVAPDKATTITSGSGIRRHSEAEALPSTPHLPSDAEDTANIAITPDTRSLQPPTPAQRVRRSPPLRLASPPRDSLEKMAHAPPLSSQQSSYSSPPPISSSSPFISPSLPMPISVRKNIQRKVPHPGLPVTRSDLTKQGTGQILVPNSDTSGTGSSQSYSQPQLLSQSQQRQRQLLSRSQSSLARDFEPPDTSTPREGQSSRSVGHTSKLFAEALPTHYNVDEQEIGLAGEQLENETPKTNVGRQEGSDSTRLSVPSAPRIKVSEVGAFDTEEESGQLQLTRTTTRAEVDFNKQAGKHHTCKRNADADNHLSVEIHSSPRRLSCQPANSIIQHLSNEQDPDGVSIQRLSQTPECPASQSSMHSLFSNSLEDERTASSHAFPISRTEAKAQGKASPAQVPGHDAEAWKEPSFLTRKKGKGKVPVANAPDLPSGKVGKRRQLSAQSQSPAPKRAKVAAPEVRQIALSETTTKNVQPRGIDAPRTGKTCSSNRPSTSTTDTSEGTAFRPSKPRLANLVVDFERINLMKRVPMPVVDVDEDIKGMLSRTVKIRTLGQEVEKNGSVYILR